jgi:hypothetical protein
MGRVACTAGEVLLAKAAVFRKLGLRNVPSSALGEYALPDLDEPERGDEALETGSAIPENSDDVAGEEMEPLRSSESSRLLPAALAIVPGSRRISLVR